MRCPQQLLDRVFDQPRIPVIPETLSQSGDQTRPLSTSRNSSTPASEVIFPPSNRAFTLR